MSRRRIRRIMKQLNLVSVYQKVAFKHYSKGKNEFLIPNLLNRHFDQYEPLEVLVMDLTYVRVDKRWAYVCLVMELFNREIIGLSVGLYKTADLIKRAIKEFLIL